MNKNAALTQAYATWGDKLLQHTDVLHAIQADRVFRPITVQLAPTEACDSNCPFCSVGNRPSGKIRFEVIKDGIHEFKRLGAKAVEITGGGNPMLYRDGGHTINDIVRLVAQCGLEVGIITNSEYLRRHLNSTLEPLVNWIRVSLAKLDEGKQPADYDFSGFEGKVALSYIMHAQSRPDILDRIAEVLTLWPQCRFVRIAADCTTEDSRTIEAEMGKKIEALDKDGKFFIKDIGENFRAHPGGCWVGMLRPYWTSTGVYICTSHVLMKRTYLPEYRLCGAGEIGPAWDRMNAEFAAGRPPYQIDVSKCGHCYYANNNRLLNAVVTELPDKNFA